MDDDEDDDDDDPDAAAAADEDEVDDDEDDATVLPTQLLAVLHDSLNATLFSYSLTTVLVLELRVDAILILLRLLLCL